MATGRRLGHEFTEIFSKDKSGAKAQLHGF
jgi:hypothetical protein